MTLVVTLLVRDEVDIVAAGVEHYLDQGAAAVVVTDNGSIDGTREVLAEYAAATDRVLVLDEPAHDYRQSDWVTRMARLAATDLGADWVINADMDEFWVPKDRTTLAESVATIDPGYGRVLARRNDLLRRRGTRGPWLRAAVWRDLLTLNQEGRPRGAKTAHRAAPDVVVAMGNHAVTGTIGSASPDEPWEIYHATLRSWPQFERTIANGGSSLAANPDLDPQIGRHWRADYERHLAGTLRAEYERRLPGARDLGRRGRAGEVRRDTFLRDHLTGLQARAVRPDLLAAAVRGGPA